MTYFSWRVKPKMCRVSRASKHLWIWQELFPHLKKIPGLLGLFGLVLLEPKFLWSSDTLSSSGPTCPVTFIFSSTVGLLHCGHRPATKERSKKAVQGLCIAMCLFRWEVKQPGGHFWWKWGVAESQIMWKVSNLTRELRHGFARVTI